MKPWTSGKNNKNRSEGIGFVAFEKPILRSWDQCMGLINIQVHIPSVPTAKWKLSSDWNIGVFHLREWVNFRMECYWMCCLNVLLPMPRLIVNKHVTTLFMFHNSLKETPLFSHTRSQSKFFSIQILWYLIQEQDCNLLGFLRD